MKSSYFKDCSIPNINNYSAITILEYATIKVIITGDNETACLKDFLEYPPFTELAKNADILLAPCHGREAGFCKEFVELINPRLTVISDSRYREETSRKKWYADNSRGWKVYFDNGKCSYDGQALSTCDDGTIFVKFGWTNQISHFCISVQDKIKVFINYNFFDIQVKAKKIVVFA